MGAFVYNNFNKIIGENVLVSRGHKYIHKHIFDNHVLLYTSKILVDNNNFYQYDNGNFIAGFGTFFYKEKFGYDALQSIFNDCEDISDDFINNIYGHYAFIISKIETTGKIYIFNDNSGTFRLYYSLKNDNICVSSSFLSVVESIENPRIDDIRLAGYLSSGIANEIPFVKGVQLLNPEEIIQIDKEKHVSFLKKMISEQPPFIDNLGEAVKYVMDLFNDQYNQLTAIKHKKLSIELTGGLDSRLLAAIIRKVVLEYDFVHYPLFGPDETIARLVSKSLNKELIIINNPPASNDIAFRWGEFDFGYNYYRHYPSNRWKLSNQIQFSGLFGECLTTIDCENYSEPKLFNILPKLINSNNVSKKILNDYRLQIINEYKKKNINSDQIMSIYQYKKFIQDMYAQRTGDSLFISAQNAHQFFYSIFNEYHFVHNVSNISKNVRSGRKLTIALIKSIDKELADLPFVSRRRTKGKNINDIESLPITYKSFNSIKNRLPIFLVNYIYKMLGRRTDLSKLNTVDMSIYKDIINVNELIKYPHLNYEIINRIISLDYIRKQMGIY